MFGCEAAAWKYNRCPDGFDIVIHGTYETKYTVEIYRVFTNIRAMRLRETPYYKEFWNYSTGAHVVFNTFGEALVALRNAYDVGYVSASECYGNREPFVAMLDTQDEKESRNIGN
jgi:hypothetical protein